MTQSKLKPKKAETKKRVVVQLWMESEAGWGNRPDGYSLHKDEAACSAFVRAYWARMPKGAIPDEYSYESGKYEGEVDEATYRTVCAAKTGLRFFENSWPPQVGQPAGHFETT